MAQSQDSYKRGQVEWALWRTFSLWGPAPKEPPLVFRTRIKRLLEIDRTTEDFGTEVLAPVRYAFAETDTQGTGTDACFSAFDAFLLDLGLELLDVGFKQAEIVLLLRFLRPLLRSRFKRALERPYVHRERLPPEDRSDCPTYEEDGLSWADCRVFMLLERVEIANFLVATRGSVAKTAASLRDPVFCEGIDALRERLHRMPERTRKVLVMEIADTAALVSEYLQQAPEVRRGRR